MNGPSVILVIDDDPIAREVVERLLDGLGHVVRVATTGTDALATATEVQPDLVLLDVMMPGIDGYEVCRRMRADPLLCDVPIIIVTALDDRMARMAGIEAGADDFISKPVDAVELRARVGTILRLNRYKKLIKRATALTTAHAELQDAYEATLNGWVRALDMRDNETEGHSQRVALLSVAFGLKLGVADSALTHLRRSALLHDIGKIGIPDAILHKQGPLSDAEWVIMRTHPKLAYDMLSPIAYLRPALDIPYSHHERWDGSGYPQGLKEGEIPFHARLFALVDSWDALSSDRPYRKAWDRERIVTHIRVNSASHFDPDLVEPFLTLVTGDDRDRVDTIFTTKEAPHA